MEGKNSRNEASSPAPQWFATAVNWLHQKPLRAQLGAPIEAQAAWGKALADNQAWVITQRATAMGASSWPSGLLPQEGQRLRAVGGFQSLAALALLTRQAIFNTIVSCAKFKHP